MSVSFPRVKRLLLATVCIVALGCRSSAPPPAESVPVEQPARPLAQLAAQRVILTPAFSLVTVDPLGWGATIAHPRDYLRQLDDELARELGERGLRTQWVYPADLVRAAKANPTYAADPYSLGVNVLRSNAMVSGSRYGDPLATQIRTMVALHDGARAVLVPVELRFEKTDTGQGVAVLRLALLDGRLGDIRWIGFVRGDPAPALSRTVLASLATHLADLIASP